jgi:hypothetical protein
VYTPFKIKRIGQSTPGHPEYDNGDQDHGGVAQPRHDRAGADADDGGA